MYGFIAYGLMLATIVVVATLLKRAERIESTRFDSHFEKIGKSFYADSDQQSIHEPIVFFISSVSTIAFFTTATLFLLKKGEVFIKSAELMKIYAFHYLKIFPHTLTPKEIFNVYHMKVVTVTSVEKFILSFVEEIVYGIIILLMTLIIVYVLSISFGRVAITLGKQKVNDGMALAIFIWMFTTLGIVMVISFFL